MGYLYAFDSATGYTFKKGVGLLDAPKEKVMYKAFQNNPKIMVEVSKYDAFESAFSFLGAKHVDVKHVTDVSRENRIHAGLAAESVGLGGEWGQMTHFANAHSISVNYGVRDQLIQKLQDFYNENLAAKSISDPQKLRPFFDDQNFVFIKDEESWLQMAYN